MKNNLKFYLMSALCSLALINTSGHSMTKEDVINIQEQIIKIKNNPKLHLTGLNNIGATCYMNATMQGLACQTKLVNDVVSTLGNKAPTEDNPLTFTKEWGKLFKYQYMGKNLDGNTNNSYSPEDFKQCISELNPLFKGITPNDSKDLYLCVVENAHNELNNPTQGQQINFTTQDQYNKEKARQYFLKDLLPEINSPVSLNTYLVGYNNMMCDRCQANTFNYQMYNFLIFPMDKVVEYANAKGNNPYIVWFNNGRWSWHNNGIPQNIPVTNIYQCLDYYVNKVDEFAGGNRIFCNRCKQMSTAHHGNKLYKLPRTIVFILNRGRDNAFSCDVNFSNILDMTQYLDDPNKQNENNKYYCSGIITHVGESGMGGHFIIYGRLLNDNNAWYCYNDGIVTHIDSETIDKFMNGDHKGTPYILFYTRDTNIKKINDITIASSIKDLLEYVTENRIGCQKKLSEEEIKSNCNCMVNWEETKFKKFFYDYDTITADSMANIINGVLRNTIRFITNYSTEANLELCKRFARLWKRFILLLENKQKQDESYGYLLSHADNICNSLLSQYNININDITENKLEDFYEEWNNEEINDLSKESDKNNIGAARTLKESIFDNDISDQFSNYTIYTQLLDNKVAAERKKPGVIQLKQTLTENDFKNLFPSLQDNNEGVLQIVRNSSDVTDVENAINKLLQQTIAFVVEYARSANKLCVNKFYNTWKECSLILEKKGPMFVSLSQQVKNVITTVIETVCEFNSEKYYLGPEESK